MGQFKVINDMYINFDEVLIANIGTGDITFKCGKTINVFESIMENAKYATSTELIYWNNMIKDVEEDFKRICKIAFY